MRTTRMRFKAATAVRSTLAILRAVKCVGRLVPAMEIHLPLTGLSPSKSGDPPQRAPCGECSEVGLEGVAQREARCAPCLVEIRLAVPAARSDGRNLAAVTVDPLLHV